MSNRNSKEYTIWNSVTPQSVTSSTDATPIVVTKASHGYSTGDQVIIYGHTTNVAANGIFKITVLSSSTFSLQDVNAGSSIAGSGAGAGSGGIVALAPKIISVEDYRDAVLTVVTANTATLTVSCAGSIGKLLADTNSHGDTPNFGATLSDTNPYSFVQIINLSTGTAVNGSTGIAVTGTDINNTYEINVNGLKYFTLIPTAFTQGAITAKIKLFTNE